jgi:hypothetical protein
MGHPLSNYVELEEQNGTPITGPLTGMGMDQYNQIVAAATAMGYVGTTYSIFSGTIPADNQLNDFFYVGGLICWVQSGSNTVIGAGFSSSCSPNGGTVSCGGGGIGN